VGNQNSEGSLAQIQNPNPDKILRKSNNWKAMKIVILDEANNLIQTNHAKMIPKISCRHPTLPVG
jgi:hypothetical protein